MAKPKQTVYLLGRMAKEIEKNAHNKKECSRIPFLLSLYVDFELRLVWYDGLP
ncbi:hypothetical protein [Sporosarcina sp. SAFN-010]|uniref:hypothetical protein n=1 Tax=Sporosarcina sp. SAFN-010 TaxID=3387273 RepID=UPI003F7E687E